MASGSTSSRRGRKSRKTAPIEHQQLEILRPPAETGTAPAIARSTRAECVHAASSEAVLRPGTASLGLGEALDVQMDVGLAPARCEGVFGSPELLPSPDNRSLEDAVDPKVDNGPVAPSDDSREASAPDHRATSWRRLFQRSSEVRLGLAIGPDRITAVEIRPGPLTARPGRVLCSPLAQPLEDGTWPGLTTALCELLEVLGARGPAASIAILRPLAHAKVIHVPPVSPRDLRQLVTRNPKRYFIGPSGRLVVDASPVGTGRRSTRAIAVCAEEHRVAGILESVSAAGLRPEVVTAAPLALAAAVCRRVAGARRKPLVIAVWSPGWREGIALDFGDPRVLQPWNADSASDPQTSVSALARTSFGDVGPDGPRIGSVVLASEEERHRIRAALDDEAGLEPLDAAALEGLEPEAIAAYGAALFPEETLSLAPLAARQVQRRRIGRRVAAMTAAAGILACSAAGAFLWGLHREINAVKAQRHGIASGVESALELRRAAGGVADRLAAIAAIEETAVVWTPAVAALAKALPDSAYLVAMTADGVQLRLAGIARSASSVVPALEASPLLHEVALTSAQRSDVSEDLQSFDVAAVLEPDSIARLRREAHARRGG